MTAATATRTRRMGENCMVGLRSTHKGCFCGDRALECSLLYSLEFQPRVQYGRKYSPMALVIPWKLPYISVVLGLCVAFGSAFEVCDFRASGCLSCSRSWLFPLIVSGVILPNAAQKGAIVCEFAASFNV